MDNLTECINNGKYVSGLFLNITKTFVTVHYGILLSKLFYLLFEYTKTLVLNSDKTTQINLSFRKKVNLNERVTFKCSDW